MAPKRRIVEIRRQVESQKVSRKSSRIRSTQNNTRVQSRGENNKTDAMEETEPLDFAPVDQLQIKSMPKRPYTRRKGSKDKALKPSPLSASPKEQPVFDYLEISIDNAEDDDFEQEEFEDRNENKRKTSMATIEAAERIRRRRVRKVHLLMLHISYLYKNRELQSPHLRATLLSLLPSHLLRQFTPEILADGRTLLNSLSMLANWWKNNSSKLDLASFLTLKGFNDNDELSVACFAATLCAFGIPTRFIASLQPVTVKNLTPSATSLEKTTCNDPPLAWVEVWSKDMDKWVPVDCIRALVNDRLVMEPAPGLFSKYGRQHLFILAYDQNGKSFDVTRRYCSRYYGWTLKLRKGYEDFIVSLTPLDPLEDNFLQSLVDSEPLPTTKAGFNGHGRYMLERQLHKYEVFHPVDAGIVGEFRGEVIRLRSAVFPVKSKEAWYTQFGRIIKEGETPAKVVKLPKKPRRGPKKLAEWEKGLAAVPSPKEYVDQPLWGEWQTVPFQPAIAENGVVPKNRFGNVDLYLPSMLPIGCVWIDDDDAWRAAKELGVDYAAACTRFAFSGRFAVPNLKGIVICAEYESPVLEKLVEIKERMANMAKANKMEEENREKKLKKKKARIRNKLIEDHGIDMEEALDENPTNIISKLDNAGSAEKSLEIDDLFS